MLSWCQVSSDRVSWVLAVMLRRVAIISVMVGCVLFWQFGRVVIGFDSLVYVEVWQLCSAMLSPVESRCVLAV